MSISRDERGRGGSLCSVGFSLFSQPGAVDIQKQQVQTAYSHSQPSNGVSSVFSIIYFLILLWVPVSLFISLAISVPQCALRQLKKMCNTHNTRNKCRCKKKKKGGWGRRRGWVNRATWVFFLLGSPIPSAKFCCSQKQKCHRKWHFYSPENAAQPYQKRSEIEIEYTVLNVCSKFVSHQFPVFSTIYCDNTKMSKTIRKWDTRTLVFEHNWVS